MLRVARLACLALGLAALPLAAQEVVLRPGDTLELFGPVATFTDGVSIEDDGSVWVQVVLEGPPGGFHLVAHDDDPVLATGQRLAGGAGAKFAQYPVMRGQGSARAGVALLNAAPPDTASAILKDDAVLLRKGSPALAPGLTPGSPWVGFQDVAVATSGDLLVKAIVDDPALGPEPSWLLVHVDEVGDESVRAKVGDVLAGAPEPIAVLPQTQETTAIDASGRWMATMVLDAPSDQDSVIVLDGAVVAREGEPSPQPGSPWRDLTVSKLALSDAGHWVFNGSYFVDGVGLRDTLVVDGAAYVTDGDLLPAFGADVLSLPGAAATLALTTDGRPLWVGQFVGPFSYSLMLGKRPLISSHQSLIEGKLVTSVVPDSVAVSPNGEWVAHVAVLDGIEPVLVRHHLGPWVDVDQGLPGSGPVAPFLLGEGSLVGGTLATLTLSGALPGGVTNLVLGFAELNASFKGGVLVPRPDIIVFGLPLDPAGALQVDVPIPVGLPGGVPLVLQFWGADSGGPLGWSASTAMIGTTP